MSFRVNVGLNTGEKRSSLNATFIDDVNEQIFIEIRR